MKNLNPNYNEVYLNKKLCPYCGSSSIENKSSPFVKNDYIYRIVKCEPCKSQWYEILDVVDIKLEGEL